MRSLSVVAVRSRGSVLLAIALGLGTGLSLVASAGAGVYHVYSCRTPAGVVAPTDGWSGSVSGPWMFDVDSCASGGALTAALGGYVSQPANVSLASWGFSAPAGTRIMAARLWRSGEARSWVTGASALTWGAAPENSYVSADVFEQCPAYAGCTRFGDPGAPISQANLIGVPPANLDGASHLYMTAACAGTTGDSCPATGGGFSAQISVYGADITLEQDAGPDVSGVSGELASAPVVRGSSDVAFDASDPGSGVYQAVFSVDGQVVQRTVVDDNNGRCRDVGGTSDGSPAFLYTQPCRASVSVDVPFDTTRVADGPHHLIVTVTDAAGIGALVLDREITIANPPPTGQPNGINASTQAKLTARWAGSRQARIASPYGRAHTIAGRLTGPGETPIEGAQLDCTTTPTFEGAKPAVIACPRTAPDGRFTIRVGRGAGSSTVRIAYRTHLGDALAAATRTLGLGVRAGVRLTVHPRTASVGRTIHFSGVLHGTPIPPGGKQLILEASSGGGWVQFDTISTDAHGRYHASHRFQFPGPATYRFRVLCPHEADFPFLAGASNRVIVREH